MVRRDANLVIEMPVKISQNEVMVKGTLTHSKINLSKDYEYVYDNLDGWNVTNLTIVNRHGRIQFPGTINIEGVDFESELIINENQG